MRHPDNIRLRGHLIRVLLLGYLFFVTVGCVSGPKSVRWGRPRYNTAIQTTDNTEMLLNFVRLKYNELPFFLEIQSISSALSVTGSANFAVPDPRSTLSAAYQERPNIIYTPLGGESFARRLLTPIDLQTIVLLHQAGWNLDRIFRVCIASVNDVRNAEPTNRPAPPRPPDYKTFLRVSESLAELEDDDLLDFGVAIPGEGMAPEVRMALDLSIRNDPMARQLLEDLRLDPAAPYFRLTLAGTGGGGDTLAIVTRPLSAAMFFLSQGIDVPEEHLQRKIVALTLEANGNPFDWTQVLGSLMSIRSSRTPPSQAFVSVPYRDHYFYIDDSDIESRTTFSFISLLFTLQAGDVANTGPVLTLPLSQ